MKITKIQKLIGLTIFFFVLISIIGAQTYLGNEFLRCMKDESKLKNDYNLISSGLPPPPTRTSPFNGEHIDPLIMQPHLFEFEWLPVTGATEYQIEMARSYNFDHISHSMNTWITSFKYYNNPDGVYHWRIRTRNNYGWGSFSSWWTFKAGLPIQDAPILTSPTHAEYITDNTVQLQWNYVMFATTYKILYSTYQDFRVLDELETSSTTITIDNLQDDTYYWKVSGKHDLSIYGPSSYAWAFTIDTVPPDIPILTSPSNDAPLKDSTPTLSWQAVSEISTYEVCVYDSLTSKFPIWKRNIYYYTSISVSTPLSDGTYYWKVKAEDRAGNVGLWSQLRSFTIDTVAPKTFIELNGLMGDNGWYVSDVTATLSATDGGSGVDSILYSSDNINWFTYVSPFTIPFEGEGTIYYKSIDEAGNFDITHIKNVKIDKKPPETNILLDGIIGNNGWFRSNVLVTLTANDGTSSVDSVFYSFDGTMWFTYNGPINIDHEGITNFYYRSIDNAGNIETTSSITIKIDTIRPGPFTLIEPLDESNINTKTPTLKWTEATDAVLYRVVVATSIDFHEPTIVFDITTTATQTITTELLDGTYYWVVLAWDQAGWGKGSGIWSFTIDTIPPATPTLLSPSIDSVINQR